MTHCCRTLGAGVAIAAGLLTGCDDPSLADLGTTLSKDGRALVQESEILRPVRYDGTVAEITRDADSTRSCDKGLKRHEVVVEGVSEYGTMGMSVTPRTLSSLLGEQGYTWVETIEQSEASSIETFQKADSDLHMRVTVTRGRPNTWKVEGRTICADAG